MRRFAIVIALVVTIASVGTWQFSDYSAALWSEDDAVHITPSKIENGTLIIGTHLIYIGALTNEIYEMAYQTVGESSQDRI
jgi:hypothetical protein